MPIYYRELKHYRYALVEDYVIDIPIRPPNDLPIHRDFYSLEPNGRLTIRKGYAWDGASGPVIQTKDVLRASLVHDVCYQMMREDGLPQEWRDEADKLLYDLCIEDGMPKWRAWYFYKAVRWFGGNFSGPSPREPIFKAP